LPARYGPSSGFGYPPDGLRPSNPRRFCFAPAALLGFTLRSFLLSKGDRPFPSRPDPRTVSRSSTRRLSLRHRFLGFGPFENPWREKALLAPIALDAPLGFCPSRVCGHEPGPRLHPDSSCVLSEMRRCAAAPMHHRVSIGSRLALPHGSPQNHGPKPVTRSETQAEQPS
jgi:hypothetical protein